MVDGEVSGVDLTRPLADEQIGGLNQALADYLAIFFHDQPISFENHKMLARHFGGIHIAPSTAKWQVPDHPEFTIIHADERSTFVAGEDWHSDVSCDPEPPLGLIMHMHTVPDTGGDTVFSSMYAAYDELSDRMKVFLEGFTATHDAVVGFAGITPEGMKLPRCRAWPCHRRHSRARPQPVGGMQRMARGLLIRPASAAQAWVVAFVCSAIIGLP